MADTTGPSVAIIGAGMSGLCMGMKLQQAGVTDFTIHEQASELGGTWRDNTYPGLSCDVPSRFYSYSFDPNPDWSSTFAGGREIHEYFRRVARDHGLHDHIRFNSEVTSAVYRDGRWQLTFKDGGEAEVDVLVSASGVLRIPRYPDIEGLETFAGAKFHSARWDHSVPIAGRRVALIGTGSTGCQITAEIADVVDRLYVFQRSAQWIYPLRNAKYSMLSRRLFKRFDRLNKLSYHLWRQVLEQSFGKAVIRPGWQRRMISATCRANLRFVIKDPELRRKLTPDHEPMCRRLIMSSRFYPAMQEPAVELVTDAIERVVPEGVVTADGRVHEADVIVLATGFDPQAFMRPMELVGENGITLEEAWENGPSAYRTVALPNFPNFFMLMGPHSPFGNQSLVLVAETQADYVVWWIDQLRAGRAVAGAPAAEATDRYNAEMRDAMPETVWMTGCKSWYLGKDGLPQLWPWTPAEHRAMLAAPDIDEFVISEPVPN